MKQTRKISKILAVILVTNLALMGMASTTNASPSLSGEVKMVKSITKPTNQNKLVLFVTSSKNTKDLTGIESSLYKGKFFRSGQESLRKCILVRESSGNYKSISTSGKYRGAYQFNPDLARGVSYMFAKEHKKLLGKEKAKEILDKLRTTPISKWNRYWQDAAFYTVVNWDKTGSGLTHWDSTRYGC